MLIDILLIDTGFHYHWIESNVIVLKIDESSNRNCWNKYPRCLKKSIWLFHLVLYLHTNMVESKEQSGCPCIASVKYFPSSSTFSCSDIFVRRLCREIILSVFEPFGVCFKGHMLLRSGYPALSRSGYLHGISGMVFRRSKNGVLFSSFGCCSKWNHRMHVHRAKISKANSK